ncbi:hypothetical protein C2845_PM12G29960 [Panicum miliaceum]|uniref:Uncharacterized protein n=1 Tax=Panicum miliaceum TaxID=4540 RepID=A0A3L6QJP1_PANMI|nr:hypothetical protein C2845_PM12G29960 [Panicum miliaceum]
MRAREIVAHDHPSPENLLVAQQASRARRRRRHMFMRRSREGRGWKSLLRRRWRCRSRSDGQLILCSSSARTDRPFVALPLGPGPASPPLGAAGPFRWRLQRKDPGWFVGEQRHVSFLLLPGTAADLGPLATAAAGDGEQGAEAMFAAVLCAAHDAGGGVRRRGRGRLLLYARPGGAAVRV